MTGADNNRTEGSAAIALTLGQFGRPHIFGRTLVVLCAYRGGVGQRPPRFFSGTRILSRLFNLVTLHPLRAHVAALRDHYANPRPVATQIALAKAVLAFGQPETVNVVVDKLLAPAGGAVELSGVLPEELSLRRGLPEIQGIDTVVMVYPDALGLGFNGLESRLRRSGATNIVAVTGRRRLFPLNKPAQHALRWRRALATTRITEIFFAVAIVPLAAALAGYDYLRGRD